MNPHHRQREKIRQSCRINFIHQPFLIPIFNFSHKCPRSLSQAKAGTPSAFGEKSHTTAHTPKQGVFRMGALSLPSERFTQFGNPAWPGIRTAHFAVFGSWPGVRQKDAESLRNSDALMRVAVPRRRGPAGLRDLFRFCRNRDSHHPNISPVISGYKRPSKSAQSIEITGFIEKSKPSQIIFLYTLLPLTA